jgi:hypothetical protein
MIGQRLPSAAYRTGSGYRGNYRGRGEWNPGMMRAPRKLTENVQPGKGRLLFRPDAGRWL